MQPALLFQQHLDQVSVMVFVAVARNTLATTTDAQSLSTGCATNQHKSNLHPKKNNYFLWFTCVQKCNDNLCPSYLHTPN